MVSNKKKKVFVAMSGGVDSSVTAALLKDAGYEVRGVTMCFNLLHVQTKRPTCCGVEGIQDARRAAEILNIPHNVLNFSAYLHDFIIEDFVSEYLEGRTPNPCVRCNQHVKFGALYKMAEDLGFDYLATGHYARVEYDPGRRSYALKKGVDPAKDQSYFLSQVKKEILPHVLFPLGDKTKNEVRQLAQKYKLNTADKPESQDLCFVDGGDYKQFIKSWLRDSAFHPGVFKDHKGEVVGEHQGIFNYTIGQRDKLGLALGYPAYVYKIEKETGTVYVGPQEYLYSRGLTASQLNLLGAEPFPATREVDVKIRYNAKEIKASLTLLEGGEARVDFHQPQKAVTPGQTVVFYEGEVVLGGAIIEKPY